MSVICFLYFVKFSPRYFDVFQEIKHLRSRAPEKYVSRLLNKGNQKITELRKINKTQILLKYFFGARGVKYLEKRRENVQILQTLR